MIKHISNATQNNFFKRFANMHKLRNYDMLFFYIVNLKSIINLFKLEIDYLKGKISEKVLDQMGTRYFVDEIKKIKIDKFKIVLDTINTKEKGITIKKITIEKMPQNKTEKK